MDLRYAIRLMRRRPWFSAAVILITALAIAATTAIFSVVHAVASLLFGVPERDPATYSLVAVALTIVAAAACAIPARRAARVDPMVALRHE